MELKVEPGWRGAFTRAHAAGAIPNGARVVKVLGERGDAQPLGAEGVVLGSFGPINAETRAAAAAFVPDWMLAEAEYLYFVEWESAPRVAVAVVGAKLARQLEAHR
jgi:hypothetical protein